jgi:hypothetical protein
VRAKEEEAKLRRTAAWIAKEVAAPHRSLRNEGNPVSRGTTAWNGGSDALVAHSSVPCSGCNCVSVCAASGALNSTDQARLVVMAPWVAADAGRAGRLCHSAPMRIFAVPQVMQFWKKAEQVMRYKTQTLVEARKKEVLDKHLDFLVGQTQRDSMMLAGRLGTGDAAGGSPAAAVQVCLPACLCFCLA